MIIQGNCLDVLKTYPDNHFAACVTDPPYGLSFMNKEWDYGIPGIEVWKEIRRTLKPGGFLLAMGGTRTFHRLACVIEDAGFEIRDCIMWLYGSGFPKSHNHFGIEGYGTALKPAWEPCIMAMKPLEWTFKQNAEKWGQAGINIDGCRVGTEDTRAPSSKNALGLMNDDGWKCKEMIVGSSCGRWPANLILDEEAARMLDEQSGYSKSPNGKCSATKVDSILQDAKGMHSSGRNIEWAGKGDSGGASRFFYCAKASSSERNEGLEGISDKIGGGMCSTVSGDTRTGHITIQKNNHPTVKPLKLMEYLIKLVMPPKDGILLDPFAGSGTTILAAKRLGFEAVGVELSEEYCEIARARLAS